MIIRTLQNNHYLAFIAFYTADSLVSSKKCGKFAGDSHAAVVVGDGV